MGKLIGRVQRIKSELEEILEDDADMQVCVCGGQRQRQGQGSPCTPAMRGPPAQPATPCRPSLPRPLCAPLPSCPSQDMYLARRAMMLGEEPPPEDLGAGRASVRPAVHAVLRMTRCAGCSACCPRAAGHGGFRPAPLPLRCRRLLRSTAPRPASRRCRRTRRLPPWRAAVQAATSGLLGLPRTTQRTTTRLQRAARAWGRRRAIGGAKRRRRRRRRPRAAWLRCPRGIATR